ncbi:LOW QUALITY PROTEIN: Hypothetical protein PHPALM_9819 [Phytophthora palmivora]|uniref:Integrase catalytic domain-containing protein n=1 Tax=Phytophthora palmivora TaxID=4796 RepID=A0A2P4Y697_9STRA|nr:LOW QUALITY PROTEIN: Hypothetical protein PHPALM_9819 [Phytophthora palmivora]
MGPTYNATERNEMLRWDYIFLGDSFDGNKLTHFYELTVTDAATTTMIASALINWSKRFGPPRMFIADQSSRFKSEVVQEICMQLAIKLDLAFSRAPWINDTVDRLNRDVLQVLRVLLMAMKLDTHECEYLVARVQIILNHTPLYGVVNSVVMESAAPRAEMVASLQHNLDEIHKEAEDIHEQRRLHNMARSSGVLCIFSTLTRHLIANKRYIFYCDASLGSSEDMLAHVGNQSMVSGAGSFKNHRKGQPGWTLLDNKDPCESLHSLYYDLTVRVESYVTEHAGLDLTRALSAISPTFNV